MPLQAPKADRFLGQTSFPAAGPGLATPAAAAVAWNHHPDFESLGGQEIILTVQRAYGPLPAGRMEDDDDRNGNGNFRALQRQYLPRARV